MDAAQQPEEDSTRIIPSVEATSVRFSRVGPLGGAFTAAQDPESTKTGGPNGAPITLYGRRSWAHV